MNFDTNNITYSQVLKLFQTEPHNLRVQHENTSTEHLVHEPTGWRVFTGVGLVSFRNDRLNHIVDAGMFCTAVNSLLFREARIIQNFLKYRHQNSWRD